MTKTFNLSGEIRAEALQAVRRLSGDHPNVERAKITAEAIIRDANSAADAVSRIRALYRQHLETRTKTEFTSVIAEDALRRRIRLDVDIERLAICRSIIHSHGGRLWAENNEPKGATVVFTLQVELEAVA